MTQSVLIVEGEDEVRLCKALTDDLGATPTHVRKAGKHKFTSALIAHLTDIRRHGPVSRIAIIRDADDDPRLAFVSVCSSVQAAGLPPPASHGAYSLGSTRVGVFIAPDGGSTGAIETLCRRSLAVDPAAACVDGYLECLESHGVLYAKNRDKSFIHAYVASQVDPVVRVGEAADQGVWAFEREAFAPLRGFLEALA